MPQSMDYYKQQANDQVKAQYAQQLQDLQNQYNQTKQSTLDSGKQTQNNYNNQVLARGLGRSSIASTGLSGIENATNKNITNLTTNYNQGIAGINTNRDSAVTQLANSLYNSDYQREWAKQQAEQAQRNWEAQQAEQKRQFDAQQALALQQIQAQRAAAAAKSSSSSVTTKDGSVISKADIDDLVNGNTNPNDKQRSLYGLLNAMSGNSSMRQYVQNAINQVGGQVADYANNKRYVSDNSPSAGSSRRISGNAVY
ncbi:MAG: hypothetical protein K0S61_696 [Anaerocolumna sp.]|jgi:hypothetical protein|nr:hypothetical protein [Anaerocolumna sp.]